MNYRIVQKYGILFLIYSIIIIIAIIFIIKTLICISANFLYYPARQHCFSYSLSYSLSYSRRNHKALSKYKNMKYYIINIS